MEDETKSKIASYILKSQARRGPKQIKEMLEKQRNIPLQKFVVANKTSWSENVKPCPETIKKRSANKEDKKGQVREEESPEMESSDTLETGANKKAKVLHEEPPPGEAVKIKIYVCCAKCNNKIPSDRKAFRPNTLDARTWCGECKKNYMAKSYKCQCGVLWYKCGMHRGVNDTIKGDAALAPNTLPAKGLRKAVQKGRPPKNQLEDLEGNFKITKKRKCEHINRAFEAPLRASMLSAGLKRKFAYLCQNGEE